MFSVQFVGRIGVFQLLSSFYLDVISLYLFKIFSIKIIRKDSIESIFFFICVYVYTHINNNPIVRERWIKKVL